MTARERVNARLRWMVGPIYLGLSLFVLGIIIGTTTGILTISLPGFAVAFIVGMIAQFLGLRCPFCRGNLAQFLLHRGNLRIDPRVCFCPYCGVSLDKDVPSN